MNIQDVDVDELMDLVSNEDVVIDAAPRSYFYNNKLKNFRVINAFLYRDNGRVWIPTRSRKKALFPGCLDASVGGHVKSGESYDEALRREALEEVCIDLDSTYFKLVAKLDPNQFKVSAFMSIYLIKYSHKHEPKFNTEDIDKGNWYTVDEALHAIAAGAPHKSDLPELLRKIRHESI